MRKRDPMPGSPPDREDASGHLHTPHALMRHRARPSRDGAGQAALRYYSEFRTMPSEDRSNCQTGRVSCIPAMFGSASTRHSILPISLGTSLAFRGIGPRHGNSRRPAVRRSGAADIGAGSSVAVVDCCLDSQEFPEIARGKMSKTMPSF